jgi:hypothetical protein
MWVALACMGLGMSGLASVSQTAGGNAPVAAKHAVLELISLEPGDCTLKLEHHWGGISGNHVYFDKHDGPFEAVLEQSPSGVRVTFNGWEEHPFVATAAQIRMIYHRPGADRVDVVVERTSGGNVRVQPVGRLPVQGKRVSIRLGGPEVRYFSSAHK